MVGDLNEFSNLYIIHTPLLLFMTTSVPGVISASGLSVEPPSPPLSIEKPNAAGVYCDLPIQNLVWLREN